MLLILISIVKIFKANFLGVYGSFSCKNCPIDRALYFVMRKLFLLVIVFLLDTKGCILKQRELVNDLSRPTLRLFLGLHVAR